jgi:cold shock CspA family protein
LYKRAPRKDEKVMGVTEREDGVIKWWGSRGYGFIIRHANNGEVFAHISDTQGFVPEGGQQVTFELGSDKKDRPKAMAIRLRGKPSILENEEKEIKEKTEEKEVELSGARGEDQGGKN